MISRRFMAAGVAVLAAGAILFALIRFGGAPAANAPGGVGTGAAGRGGSSAGVTVVAAENFYGNIASQIGGGAVTVTSLLSNPNVDPHEYEPTVADSAAVANAAVVIENGLSYDAWMDKLIAASPNPARTVVIAGQVAPDVLPNNPHVWYGVGNIRAIAAAIATALAKADPADESRFAGHLAAFDSSLDAVQSAEDAIKSSYAGTPIGLTETIFLYQTQAMGLAVLTPFSFEKAIAEGNDPAAADVAAANADIAQGRIKVLVFNSQTVTPITTNLQNAARSRGIPTVPVTETMPAGATYQSWMLDQLSALRAALATGTGH